MQANHLMWAEIIEAAGAKRLADATGYDLSTIYKHQRHPFDVDHLNGTGERGILDRLEATIDLLAARTVSRVTLRKLQLYVAGMFTRALDRGEPTPQSAAALSTLAVTALRELADVLDECRKTDCDEEQLINETLQVQNILESILSAAEAGLISERQLRGA